MLTQCPSCQTTFRVTSEILRVAHGQVRCGRCQTQFDALERLIEETDDGGIESGRYMRPPRAIPQPPPQPGTIEVEEPIEHEDITLEGRHIEISGVYEGIDETGQGQPQIHEEVIEEWVEIDQDDATLDTEPEVLDMREEYSGVVTEDEDIQAAAEEIEAAQADNRADRDDAQEWSSEQWTEPQRHTGFSNAHTRAREAATAHTRRAQARVSAASEEGADFDFSPPETRASTPLVWKILGAPLVLLLLVQVVHHYRATLARHPQIGAPLQSVYGALGLTLRPDWNLHAYEVRQWGVVADPATPGTLRVRASVKNLADFPQPYPLLKLVLEDRWGDQVRAREFDPAEYLDPTTAPDRMLAPAQQTNASVAIVDPGPDAEGFRFDVCLRGARGPVCAADVPGGK
jgi:predicted Zn finger-like uncharacterized protein